MLFFIFFFQAEDGIRDGHVTGVQTCALPILAVEKERIDVSLQILPSGLTITGGVQKRLFVRYTVARSEERRVGKECRSRGSPYNKRRKGRHKRGEEMMKQ